MKGHKWELFILSLSFIGWVILAILPLLIGMVIVVLMGSTKLLPIFSVRLIWLFVYKDTIYRVYYLSISKRSLELAKDELNKDIEIEE